MIKPETVKVIKSTLPILQQHGETLTTLFYKRLFENNPEIKPLFNPAHQQQGSQQRALAAAICAYAEHIETPEKLANAVELIAQKHASLGIQAEMYPIVGENLLAAIKELLGDAATEEIIAAWAEAYTALVDVFVNREQAIYDEQLVTFGWQGFKDFKVIKREDNSENITSFYLHAVDGTVLTPHQAGQYITVKVSLADGATTMRNYSLSNPPGTDYFRISVKRETSVKPSMPQGVVSNLLHNTVEEGDIIAVAPPAGEFFLKKPTEKPAAMPIVFIAGGVGITPLLSMLHTVLESNSHAPVTLIQTAVNGDSHAFEDEIKALSSRHKNLNWHVRYSEPSANDRSHQRFNSEGLIDDSLIKTLLSEKEETQFYVCGPEPMLKLCYKLLRSNHVATCQIHYEFFGPADNLEKYC